MTTKQRNAVVFLLLYLACLGWVAYSITADPDPTKRRLTRLSYRYRALQSIAETFGELGLHAERAYQDYAEKQRTI